MSYLPLYALLGAFGGAFAFFLWNWLRSLGGHDE